MLDRRYNPLHEIDNSPDIREYMEKFYCIAVLKDNYSQGPKLIDINSWCYKYLGAKFKDWFLITGGSKGVKLLIKNPKRATLFFLQYGDAIDVIHKLKAD